MNFHGLNLDINVLYWAYIEWSQNHFTGELYDFLPQKTKDILTYFTNTFDAIWEAVKTICADERVGRIQNGEGFIGLPDNGGIYYTKHQKHTSLKIHLHDNTGFPHICTIEIPNTSNFDFMRSFIDDMKEIGWK
jgi:hypothetical protein